MSPHRTHDDEPLVAMNVHVRTQPPSTRRDMEVMRVYEGYMGTILGLCKDYLGFGEPYFEGGRPKAINPKK